jgi:CheY-like chemotaxis protein
MMPSVLVVDDDADTRDLLCRFLESIGYKVFCAVSGREALAAVIDHTPDVIISDLNMPDMNGVTLLETLRAYVRLQTVPLILWTGAADSLMLERAKKLGISAVLIKAHATLDEIRSAIDRALRDKPTGDA